MLAVPFIYYNKTNFPAGILGIIINMDNWGLYYVGL